MGCPRCGFENLSGLRFCNECGAPLPLTCRDCGFTNAAGSKFCGACGASLAPPPAAASRPAGPPEPTGGGESAVGLSAGRVGGAEAERRQLTVMFCDLVGSTALSTRLDPEELREVLRAYHEVCERLVGAFGGLIAKYLGDGLLVYFGYPAAHEDDAQRAVRAGLGIVEGLVRLNARLEREHGLRLAARIGIDTGLVVVGEMGAGQARESMAIVGETANLAARLQEVAEPNSVVISGATYRLIRGFFDCRPLGEQPMKGIDRPVAVHAVLHESAARSRLDAAAVASAGLTPLIDRAPAVRQLLERWEQARAGRGQVVLIEGEAGIGKSRLVQELKERVARDPDAWLTPCQCSPYHQDSALYPLVDVLQRVVLRLGRDETPAQRLSKLEGFLVRYGFDLADAVPLFAALLEIPLDERYAPPALAPAEQMARTQQALLTVLAEIAAKQPALFVVEDLHWVDPTTLELLGRLVERLPASRILAVFTYRPEFRPPWLGREHVQALRLERLDQAQVAEMVDRLALGKRLPGEIVEQVVAKTDGVPLFVEELTKMVLESGLLREQRDRYELAGHLPAMAIPATLHDSLMARLDRLGTSKELAQLGATLGREFSYDLLRAVSGWTEPALRRELGQLVEAELVFQQGAPPAATYLFKHALIQDAAYESQLRSRRQAVHRHVARVLSEQFPEVAETQPEVLAHHYTAAGLVEPAIDAWRRAGVRAAERSANQEAINHLTRALDLLATLPESEARDRQELALRIALGGPLMAVKGYSAPETRGLYSRARTLAERVGGAGVLFPLLYGQWVGQGNHAEVAAARETGEEFLRLAEQRADPALVLLAHRLMGFVDLVSGDLAASRRHHERAVAHYDPPRHRALAFQYGQDPGAVALSYLAWIEWLTGYPDRAARTLAQAIAAAQAANHLNTLCYVLILGGAFVEGFQRNLPAVEAHTATVLAVAREHRLSMWLAIATTVEGWTVAELGRHEAGIVQMVRGLHDMRATDSELFRPYLLSLLAQAHAAAGQPAAGLGVLDEALALAEATGERWWEAELHRLRGELRLQHDPDAWAAAEAGLCAAIEVSRRQGARMLELRALLSLHRLLPDGERRDEARGQLARLYATFDEGFDTPDLREATLLLGQS